jgi:ABC-type multidrug transport system ATPase subunit
MKVLLKNIYKKYENKIIFNDINFEFSSPVKYGISGPNGSGKSTLLKLIASAEYPNKGNIIYYDSSEHIIQGNLIYKYLSIVSPYIEVSNNLTLKEVLKLHFKFKQSIDNYDINKILSILEFQSFSDKFLSTFSSGMKQKVKIALALLSNTPLVLFDEPAMNLDDDNIKWFQDLTNKFSDNRLIIIFSNNRNEELTLCNKIINIKNI